jgi:hypothetical protein
MPFYDFEIWSSVIGSFPIELITFFSVEIRLSLKISRKRLKTNRVTEGLMVGGLLSIY